MKKYLIVGAIILIGGVAAINARELVKPKECGAACEVKIENTTVTAKEFEARSKEQNVVLLDVRTREEYQQGHIRSSTNLDFNNQAAFMKGIDELDKSKTYLVYCRSGNRSAQAQKLMYAKGISTVNLSGGIGAWQSAGLPVEK